MRLLVQKSKAYLTGTLLVCVRAYLLIMLITFLELAVGLTVIGVEHALYLAALIAVFDILPILGTGGIMLPWAAVTLIQGAYGTGIGLLILYCVITVIRNIIEPKIVGTRLGLHPVVTLASMYVGVQILGIAGLLGGPIMISAIQQLYLGKWSNG